MKVICVSGTPGTGKTFLSKKLAKKLNFYYLDVNDFIGKNKLYGGYDRKRRTKIVDIPKLNRFLLNGIRIIKKFSKNEILTEDNLDLIFFKDKINERAILSRARSTKTLGKLNINKLSFKKIKYKKIEGIIIDSHLSHFLPKKYVDVCIVTKCNIKKLNKRLKKRKYNSNKIQENLQAEIFDICHIEAERKKHSIIIIDTTKGFNINHLIPKLCG